MFADLGRGTLVPDVVGVDAAELVDGGWVLVLAALCRQPGPCLMSPIMWSLSVRSSQSASKEGTQAS